MGNFDQFCSERNTVVPQAEIAKSYFCDFNAKIETFLCADKSPKRVWHKDEKKIVYYWSKFQVFAYFSTFGEFYLVKIQKS